MKKKFYLLLTILVLVPNLVFAKELDTRILKTDREYLNKTYEFAKGNKAPKINLDDFTFLKQSVQVLASDDDYLWAVAGNEKDGYAKVLYRSSDLGESYEKVYVFKKRIEGIHISPQGVIFVSISDGRWEKNAGCEIFRSDNQGKSFKRVLKLKSGAAINWNFASDEDGYVFISEYGYKELPNNARRIYRSKDSGLSFQIVYEPKEVFHSHNHVIQIDKDNKNIIYQSVGDIHKQVLVSYNRGDSWQKLIHDINPTALVQVGDKMLFGLDNHPRSGIMAYDKKTKKLGYSFMTPPPYKGSIYDILYEGDILYAGLMSYSQKDHTWPGTMFISRDRGKNWENALIWPKITEKSGIGFYNMVAKDGYGFINCMLPMYVRGEPGHYTGTVRFKLK